MSERTCIATGQTLPRHSLLRFVAGPDGHATLDLAEKLPGRGAWIMADATALKKAAKKGQFPRAIGVGLDDVDAEIQRVGKLIRARVLASAGMARRAGLLIGGSGKLQGGGSCEGLLAASDASPRELRRLQSKLGVEWTCTVLSAQEIGQIFGRESMAFAGLMAAQRPEQANLVVNLQQEIKRMEGFYASSGCNLHPDGCIT